MKNKKDKPCKHPINKQYYKYDPVSHRQRLFCRRCGQLIVSYR